MRYSDYKCDGCQKVFSEDDDIVVCPECATPQHRECYNEKGGCVNAHLHSEGFQWQGERLPSENKKDELPQKAEEIKKDLVCPNCQHLNPHGSTFCQKCGMKFTIFGINLAEKAQEEEENIDVPSVNPDIEPKMTPPSYPPPFTVGSGDEQNEEQASLPHNKEEQMENFLSSTIANASGYNTADNSENLFKGPFPDDMKIEDIPANTMGAFLARDSQKYIEKFRRISSGKKLSFNWAAFFFSPYWFFFRKQFKPGVIFMTLQLCLNIIMTPAATAFLEFSEYMATLDLAAVTDAQAADIALRMNELMAPMLIFMAAEFIIKLVAGFVANPLYKNYTVSQLKILETIPEKNGKLTHILKYGGISPILPFAAYFAEQLLSIVAGMFF